jgi:microcystin-dependent protein
VSDPYLGEIRMFAGSFAPVGWKFCNGTLLPISQFDALYSLIGTTYGGDGQTTFALPDLRGRVPVGQGDGPGLSPRTMGESYGVETVTLTTQQIPGHSHTFNATAGATSAPNPQNALFANTGGDNLYVPDPNSPQPKALGQQTVLNAGSSQPHNNIMSSVGMNYIICHEGIYPSRN